jgi:ATP-dependent RNA helicase SUPV3L1/SUV3
MMAPIPWREEALLEIISKFIQMYSDNMSVDLLTALRGTHYMPTMLRIEEKIAAGVPPTASTKVLETLEALHKILVVYIWMSFRNSVAYNSQVDVVALKKRVEVALEWALQGLSTQYNFAPMKDTRSAREAARVIPYDTKADRILRGTPLSKLVKAA